jgi:hypothetical protein
LSPYFLTLFLVRRLTAIPRTTAFKAGVMLVSIEAAIDGCVKADGGIVAAFLSDI